ncbi:MAG: GumC family protein [Candidatus Hydrothermia bacterium]
MSDFLALIRRYLKLFFIVYVVGFLVALLLYFVLPRKYKATAEVMPSLDPETFAVIGSSLANFNPLLGLMVSPVDIYARIAQSRGVLYPVIDSLDLRSKFKTKSYIKTYRKLLKSIEIKTYTEGILELSYEDKDKYFATNLVNLVVRELDRANKELIMTKGKALREFLEKRMAEEEASINSLRDTLEQLQKRYGTLDLEAEYAEWVKAYYEMLKNYLMSRTEYDYLKQIYSESSPLLILKEKELKVYDEQLRGFLNEISSEEAGGNVRRVFNVPYTKLPTYARQYMELKVKLSAHEEVYKFLFTKYEEAKILEKRDTPTFTVLRYAEVPDYKSYPKGTHLVLLFFFLSTVINIVILLVKEGEFLSRAVN